MGQKLDKGWDTHIDNQHQSLFFRRYEHEAPAADNIRIITPSEHDGGYSLNYEARQNANKLNQSVRTIKAYRQRIKACYSHKANGLKKEPNDTGGPNIDTKINELELTIRDATQSNS